MMATTARLGPMLNAVDPDLSTFRANGGKLLMYHGWSDQNIAPRNTIGYVERVAARLGPDSGDMLRLFMVPGMRHCEGGPGFRAFDALAALEAWVETGKAPSTILGTNPESGLSRPLCAYPTVVRFTSGDATDPGSFTCR